MKRILILGISLFLVTLLAVGMWPSQSDSSRALSMIRESCGLEEIAGRWEFNNRKALTNSKARISRFEELPQDEKLYLEAATRKNAIIAQRAAFLDSRWLPLADALVVVNNNQILILTNQYRSNSEILVDSKLKVYYKCSAIKDESNS